MSEKNVTIVIPTSGRLKEIQRTIKSYLTQEDVLELIYVDDGGTPGLEHFLSEINIQTPHLNIRYARIKIRSGAAAARNIGIKIAHGQYILFGEDDAYLCEKYASSLKKEIDKEGDNVIVSGNIIMLQPSESLNNAKIRYKTLPSASFLDMLDNDSLTINFNHFPNEQRIEAPFTHALFMAKRERLEKFGFDEFYFPGNGYREETDFQMNSYCNNGRCYILRDIVCYHMARSDVRHGGQRKSRIKQYYYCIIYNNHFYNKYYASFSKKRGLNENIKIAKIRFSIKLFFIMFIFPLKNFFR